MTPRDSEFVAELCGRKAGLYLDPEKSYLLESRLAPVARREGFGSVDELVQALRDRGEERLAWATVEAMTLPETSFFRDPQVFAALRDRILPELAEARDGQPVRIWCAACGSGQEVYSLAMMLAEAPAIRVELFASDLSSRLLEKAQSGLYTQFEVQRGLSARLLVRHFEKKDDLFAISPKIRQMVRWRRVNLVDDITRLGRFEMVLCRNLLGSLTDAARPVVMRSLVHAVRQGGCLVLGAEEQAVAPPGMAVVEDAPGLFTRVRAARAAA